MTDYGKFAQQSHSRRKRAPPKPKEERFVDKLPACTAQYDYIDGDGVLQFVVQRYDTSDGKRFSQYTPRGNKWKIGLDMEDGRPLYNLRGLRNADPERPVLVVEGEKCVELLKKNFPKAAAVCWAAGTNSVHRTQWMPLFGRDLTLCSDPDIPGRIAMYEVAMILTKQCKNIQIVLPPLAAKGEKKIDIGDVIEEKPDSLPDWITGNIRTWDRKLQAELEKLKQDFAEARKKEAKKRTSQNKYRMLIRENPHFDVLGIEDEQVVIEIKGRNAQDSIPKAQFANHPRLMMTHICADNNWWMENFAEVQPRTITEYIVKLAKEIGVIR